MRCSVTEPPGWRLHDPLAWDAFLCLYRACGQALRERCAPSVLPWPDHSALVEDAARGLMMYGAWG
jgi:hypothetical protein